MATEIKRGLTPSDIADMLDRGELDPETPFELVDGEIVWLIPAKSYHGLVTMTISGTLFPFSQQIGAVLFSEATGYLVGKERQQLRSPDVGMVLKERRHIIDPDSWVSAAPDLAVEVLSEGQEGEAYATEKVPE